MIAKKLSPYDETKTELDKNQENFINRLFSPKTPISREFLKMMENGRIFTNLITCNELVYMLLPKYFSFPVPRIEFYKIESSHS